MEHTMKLFPSPFERIQSGDDICFVNSDDPSQKLRAQVVNLFIYDSFDALYRALPLLECGYTEQNLETASPRDMDAYYTKEQQETYGVVGIQIQLL